MNGGFRVGGRILQRKHSGTHRDLSAVFLFRLLLIDSSQTLGIQGDSSSPAETLSCLIFVSPLLALLGRNRSLKTLKHSYVLF